MPIAMANMVVVIMGPCGVGKSAVASMVGRCVGGTFIEADDHHTAEARARMARGSALGDDVRIPWLDRVAAAAHQADRPTMVACSALKRAYRDRLRRVLGSALFVQLTAPRAVIAKRLSARQGHFAGVDLLDSQLAALEPLGHDEAGITLDVRAPLASVGETVLDFMAANAVANFKRDDVGATPDAIRQHMQGR